MNIEQIKRFIPEKKDKEYAYKMGYDCGLNGSNLTNCAFNIFSSTENTKEWERGKKDAEGSALDKNQRV